MIKDILLYRIKKSSKISNKINDFIILNYLNKLMDKIKFKSLLISNSSTERLPISKEHILKTGITYKYTNTIRNKITNYNQTVKNPDWNIECKCNRYADYIDEQNQHVITGDLNIIEDIPTREILEKGLNYRLKQTINKGKTLTAYTNCIESLIDKLSTTTNTPIELFSHWKEHILELVMSEVNRVIYKKDKKDNINFKYLKNFQKAFVITPVDKASKNIGIICKKFYLEVLKKEIESANFQTSSNETHAVISDYSKLLKDNYNYNPIHVPTALPFIYWIPKFHKTPVGTRFITSGRDTVISALSKNIGIGLKHMINIEKTNCKIKHKYKQVRHFYIIEDNKEIIEYMIENNLFNNNKKYIKTFDFKTLYTDIPHDELKNNIKTFINWVFILKDKRYINIGNKTASFSNKSKTFGSFTKDKFILQINFLIDNSFIYFDNKLERLVIGIPTGTNCASDLANIFLHVYEKSNVETLIENHNLNYLSSSGDTFRYQDDLINFNNRAINDQIITEVYPRTMTIKNTSISDTKVVFLDLSIEIVDNMYIFNSYDKRKDFDFPITNFPNLRGNIPENAAYGVFTSQLVRYCRINLQIGDFIKDCKQLVIKLVSQAFNENKLRNKYIKFCNNYIHIWAHFGADIASEMISSQIFSY